jgi:outer membrane protein TolC
MIDKNRFYFYLIIFLILNHYLLSEEDLLIRSPVQLNTLIEEVLKRNPNLEAAHERVRAAAEVVPRVQVIDDPEFKFLSDFNKFKSKSEFIPMLQYQISQTFPFPGKLRLKGKVASEVLKQFQNSEITTEKDLILQTKKLYFQLILNQASLSINQNNRDVSKNIIDDSLALYRSGKGSYEEVIKAQIELQKLDEELLSIEADHIFIISMLNTLLNRPQSEEIGKPEEITSFSINLDYEKLAKIAMQERPELKELKAMVQEQEMMARLAKREYFPDFTISAGYEQITENLSDNAWVASLSFKIPLWIAKRQKRQVREAKAQASANLNALRAMEAMIQGQIQDILGKLKATEERLLLYQTGLLPKILEALKASEVNYRSGKGDFLILLDTRRQYQNLELEYERVKAARETWLAELERTIGIPLEEVQ